MYDVTWRDKKKIKVKTYHCDSCSSYCEVKKEGAVLPKNICIETGENFNDKKNLKRWYLVKCEKILPI